MWCGGVWCGGVWCAARGGGAAHQTAARHIPAGNSITVLQSHKPCQLSTARRHCVASPLQHWSQTHRSIRPAMSATTTAASVTSPASLHPNLSALAPLIGVWTGTGAGAYPTIKPFQYTETITFTSPNPATPVLTYTQSTAINGKAAHSESGYWKVGPGGLRVECCVAQVTGLVEVEEGSITADEKSGSAVTVDVRTVGLTRTTSAKPPHVREIRRVWRLSEEGGRLGYELFMATEHTPELTSHLTAHFSKQQPTHR